MYFQISSYIWQLKFCMETFALFTLSSNLSADKIEEFTFKDMNSKLDVKLKLGV